MNRIGQDSVVDLLLQAKWRSETARHTEVYHAAAVNIWRDTLPPSVTQELMGRGIGDRLPLRVEPDNVVFRAEARNHFRIGAAQFDGRRLEPAGVAPRAGRFYPRGVLKGVAGVFPENIVPFRCVEVNNGHLWVDFNHPLSEKPLELTGTVGKIAAKSIERGGTSNAWIETLLEGPGIQAPWQGRPTDYFSDDPFVREDETADALFYRNPRWVHHLDDTARDVVQNLHARLLEEGMRVLDLMSSWHSHLPEALSLKRVGGLGLNAAELGANRRLTDHVVQDLNENPRLPYEDGSFDAVVCTASIEYLTDPFAVFQEVRRVLRPGGRFIVTFSNRWFPPKAIRIWKQLHEYERMGLVLAYFSGFEALHTYSFRGLPRPTSDRHFPRLRLSDPIYAVWGSGPG